MDKKCRRVAAYGLVVAGLSLLMGCQKVSEPVPILTQNQWQRVQEHILSEAPEVEHPVGAIFGGMVELIGYDLEPDVIELGDMFTVTWYWRVLQELDDRWEIFVHLDRASQRQNLDHEAVNGLFTSLYWEEGQIIRDAQQVRLEPSLGGGTVQVLMGFWRRSDDSRLPISQAGTGAPQPDGRLLVGSFETRLELLTLEARHTRGALTIDGSLRESDWRTAPQTEAFVHPNSGDEVREAHTQARALWDEDALYIGLTASDEDIWATYTDNDSNLWEEEVLEVYLDPLGDGRNYVEIQVNPLGAVFDARFARARGRDPEAAQERTWNVEGMESAVVLNPRNALESRENADRRWTVELRIPWASLPDFGQRANEGDTIRANFYRYDRPADSIITAAWAPVYGGSFHQPDKFGEIRLMGAPGVEGRPTPREGLGREGEPGEEAAAEGTGRPRAREAPTIRLRQPIIPRQLRPAGTSIH